MKTILQIVIGVAVVILAFLLYESLMQPIRFNENMEYRKGIVVERLKDVRDLQIVYRSEHGRFTGDFDTLINFYKSGNISIIRQIGSLDDSIAVARKLIKRDTIHMPVRDSLFKNRKDFVIDSIKMVPFVGKQFQMKALIFKTLSQVEVPLFEASVSNDVYLFGLDRQAIVNLNDDLKTREKFQGIKVGDVVKPNNNAGNWE